MNECKYCTKQNECAKATHFDSRHGAECMDYEAIGTVVHDDGEIVLNRLYIVDVKTGKNRGSVVIDPYDE